MVWFGVVIVYLHNKIHNKVRFIIRSMYVICLETALKIQYGARCHVATYVRNVDANSLDYLLNIYNKCVFW